MTNDSFTSNQWCVLRNERIRKLRDLWMRMIPSAESEALSWAIERLEGMPEHWVAADEIERLTAERDRERNRYHDMLMQKEGYKDLAADRAADIERLRAALNDACQSVAVHGEQPPVKWLEALGAAHDERDTGPIPTVVNAAGTARYPAYEVVGYPDETPAVTDPVSHSYKGPLDSNPLIPSWCVDEAECKCGKCLDCLRVERGAVKTSGANK